MSVIARRLAVPPEPSPGGPVASFDDVYARHASAVGRWAVRLGGPKLDADDIVQEVFVLVHEQLPRFRPEARLTTWLFRITRNVVRTHLRRERWSRRLGRGEEVPESLADPSASASEGAERLLLRRLLYRVLDQMSEKYRTILVLFEIEERSGEEISELLGVKLATVWVWLHRARLDFQKRLGHLREAEETR